ncbi:uncharacterized protein LOC129741357 [Uranotaenia lowii]|uniref:uncharacterized protein LOC129741357 n=1 Tax=Uranotaenia lowii TaxID=190385 RepID=UPI002478361F|nr:uncharacterized protein LOC129741357 [Uranotaenia lowii]
MSLRELSAKERRALKTIDSVLCFVDQHSDIDHQQVEVRLQLLESAYSEFVQMRLQIELLLEDEDVKEVVDEDASDTERLVSLGAAAQRREEESDAIFSKAELKYCQAKSALLKFLHADIQHSNTQPSHPTASAVESRVKLPEIRLPTFSGRLEEWIPFRDAFKSLIHQSDKLSERDKFTYLRASLSGEALQEIGSIALSGSNYDVAWNVLEDRYQNHKLIVKAHLDYLFAIERMKRENFECLNQLISDFEKHLQMLAKIGEDIGGWSTILVHMVCCRLDPITLKLWETNHNSKEVPCYENLIMFLKNHCSVLQSLSSSSSSAQSENRKPRFGVNHAATSGRCSFCAEFFHSAFVCRKFQKMTVAQRYEAVKKIGLCMNCLAASHLARNCTRGFCRQCGRRHHTLLHSSKETNSVKPKPSDASVTAINRNHPDNRSTPQQQQPLPRQQQQQTQIVIDPRPPTTSTALPIVNETSHSTHPLHATDPNPQPLTIALPLHSTHQILLSTALVKVSDSTGRSVLARALLDSCSQNCFVTSKLCRQLRLKEFSEILNLHGIGGTSGCSRKAVRAKVAPRIDRISSFLEEIHFNVLPSLTVQLPSQSFSIGDWTFPRHMTLADPEFHERGEIDMLIGAEYYLDLLRTGQHKVSEDGPTMQETVFGWILAGRIPESKGSSTDSGVQLCTISELHEQVTKFWELETCHEKSTNSVEESLCEELFKQTTSRDETGRFVVSLPKKDFVLRKLGDSRANAEKRFYGLEKRFVNNPSIKEMYLKFIQEYQDMGHMKLVPDSEEVLRYFLPHHHVLKPESTTTKLRVVFDASCPTTSGVSLNDGLMVGPIVQDDLITIVTRFRLHKFAIVADIAKMYRMINLAESDQRYQCILWRNDSSEPLRTYKLTTVTYGTASAPFLATRCLQKLSEDGEQSHPLAAKILRKDFYMDDALIGIDTPEEGKQAVKELNDLLCSVGFVLCKYNSNCEEILADIPADLLSDRTALELDSFSTVTTLGLIWEPSTDLFHFRIPTWSSSSRITKRIVLSDASKLFDPLGLVGPVIVQAKMFIQSLWQLKCGWDDPLTDEMQLFWTEFRRNLSSLDTLSIPRWVGFSPSNDVELHGFCDASEKAYGACIYLRCTHEDGSVSVKLLISKSRVAPLEDLTRKKRKQSIPRQELSSALLLSHLYEKFCKSTAMDVKSFFWTDSTIVKCWLASVPSRWQAFVANRVSEIQHLTKKGVWNHIPGTENPADIISRGMTPVQLQYQMLWFEGPIWLKQNRSTWPVEAEFSPDQFDKDTLEEKSSVVLPIEVTAPNEIFSRLSTFTQTVRLVAWMQRYCHNAKKQNTRKIGNISFEEFLEATKVLVKLSQAESFGQELKDLSHSQEVRSTSRIASLNPHLVDGIIRVGGRLANAPVSENRKHPIILDHHHPLSVMIVQHYHEFLYHAGQQLLIASVRGKYWVTSLRGLARKTIHSCVQCFRVKPKVMEQLMADLPPDRVNPAPPFQKVGVDYCGPFLITYPHRRSSPMKCFVSVFVCLVCKAVHLELVADLTTGAFLGALKRFIGRRGKPILIMSDNGRNFVGARREIAELQRLLRSQQFQTGVIFETCKEGINFKFIPARSPNFGGLWEAAVKSFKTAFKRTVALKVLQYDEMTTTLAQIEAVLNSRPLTPLSDDPDDFEALTPGHFLIQRALTALDEPDLTDTPENQLTMWQRATKYAQVIWKKWSKLYLSDLHNRTRWTRKRNNISVGSMVLLMDERLPSLKWPLARVTEVFHGSDGNIRVVNVRTQDGTYGRSISKICVLPILDNFQKADGEN